MTSFYFRQANEYNPKQGLSEEIYINNFGYYKGIQKDMQICREQGRCDYHVLYVSSGEIIANGKRVKSGEFYIYLPDCPQRYTYLSSQKSTLYYWIHFTGYGIPKIISDIVNSSGLYNSCAKPSDATAILEMIADELSHSGCDGSPYAVLLLEALLYLLAKPKQDKYPFSRAIALLEDFTKPVSVKEIAEIYNVSTSHFIRSFKESYGKTPANYRIEKQISHAKNLLSETALQISDVAAQCGICDSFYFSRIFKKHTGMTPSEYRKASL